MSTPFHYFTVSSSSLIFSSFSIFIVYYGVFISDNRFKLIKSPFLLLFCWLF